MDTLDGKGRGRWPFYTISLCFIFYLVGSADSTQANPALCSRADSNRGRGIGFGKIHPK